MQKLCDEVVSNGRADDEGVTVSLAVPASASPIVHKPVGIKAAAAAGLFHIGVPPPPPPPMLPPPPPELRHRLTAFLQKNYAATQHLTQQLHHLNTLSLTRQACSLLNKVVNGVGLSSGRANVSHDPMVFFPATSDAWTDAQCLGAAHGNPPTFTPPSAATATTATASPDTPPFAENGTSAPTPEPKWYFTAVKTLLLQILWKGVSPVSQSDSSPQDTHWGAAVQVQVLRAVVLYFIQPSATCEEHPQQGEALQGKT